MKIAIDVFRLIQNISRKLTSQSFVIIKLFVIAAALTPAALLSRTAAAHSLAGKTLAEKISMVPQGGIGIKDFSLADTQGSKVSYPKLAAGDWSIVYFGFTNCKSACPMTASYLRAELSDWPADYRPKVIFISVDPATDKPDVLKKWLGHFDGSWIGLTGTKSEIEQAAKPFGVSHGVSQAPNSGDTIQNEAKPTVQGAKATAKVSSGSKGNRPQTPQEVMHSSYLYIVDPSGQWRAYLPAPAKKGVLKEGLISLGIPLGGRKPG